MILFYTILGILGFSALLSGLSLLATGIMSLLGIVFYIMKSIGLYTMAKRRDIEPAFLSWIPLLDLLIIGKLVISVNIGPIEIKHVGILLILGELFVGFSDNMAASYGGFWSIARFLAVIVLFVYDIYVYRRLYSIYAPESATLLTILSVIFPVAFYPIFVFILRNRSPYNLYEFHKGS